MISPTDQDPLGGPLFSHLPAPCGGPGSIAVVVAAGGRQGLPRPCAPWPPPRGAARLANLLTLLCALAACGPGQRVAVRSAERPPIVDMSLGAADVFDVRVFGEADLTGTYRVAADGTIDFPLIGRITAGGRTPAQLADEIQRRLEQYIKQPQVSVLLKESNSKKVTVYGQVGHPGTIAYTDPMTIAQAISVAGGLTSMAARESVRVTRKRGGRTETVVVNLKAVQEGTRTFYLQPGDEVFVPERVF